MLVYSLHALSSLALGWLLCCQGADVVSSSIPPDDITEFRNTSNVTLVSGYWKFPSKHPTNMYARWLRREMEVSCPVIFFYQQADILQFVRKVRDNIKYPTMYIKRDLEDAAVKFDYSKDWIHPIHLPRYKLGIVWLDKVFMMAEAAQLNPFNSQWFAWNGEHASMT
jgi:hypothetical protein